MTSFHPQVEAKLTECIVHARTTIPYTTSLTFIHSSGSLITTITDDAPEQAFLPHIQHTPTLMKIVNGYKQPLNAERMQAFIRTEQGGVLFMPFTQDIALVVTVISEKHIGKVLLDLSYALQMMKIELANVLL